MAIFDKIIVGLDFTPMDDTLLRYTRMLVQETQPEKLYFFYVINEIELPDTLKIKHANSKQPIDEIIKAEMYERIYAQLGQLIRTEVQAEVYQGDVTDSLLDWSNTKFADLIILGHKAGQQRKRTNFKKIINRSHCSVLIVPQGMEPRLGRIFVPVDFSDVSEIALKSAIELAKPVKADVLMQNVYKVPMGYHSSGKTYNEFAEIMKGHATKESHDYLAKLEIPQESVELVFTLDDDSDPVDKIYLAATSNESDLIAMGSKGRTFGASLLLGSVSSRMAVYESGVPLLIIKDRQANLNWVEALLNI